DDEGRRRGSRHDGADAAIGLRAQPAHRRSCAALEAKTACDRDVSLREDASRGVRRHPAMWPVGKRAPAAPTGEAVVMLPGGKRVDVIGEASYQENIERITGGKKPKTHRVPVTAALVCEPTNPKDRYAVLVLVQGLTVGYLSRTDAVR